METAATNKVDRKTAEQDFNRWAEAWEIDLNLGGMDKEDKKSFESQKEKLIKAIEIGRAVINDAGDPEYTLKDPVHETTMITFRMPTGEGYMEMDRFGEDQNVRKSTAVIAHMTRKPVKFFAGMSGIDYKFCLAVSALFLGS